MNAETRQGRSARIGATCRRHDGVTEDSESQVGILGLASSMNMVMEVPLVMRAQWLMLWMAIGLCGVCLCDALGQGDDSLTAVRVDVLERVFPDRAPGPRDYGDHIAVPRGGTAPFQFAVMAKEGGRCTVRVSPVVDKSTSTNPAGAPLDAAFDVYAVRNVPVEANNNGGSRTAVGTRPPDEWMEHLVREAPFQVAEVLVKGDESDLLPGRWHTAVVDVKVSPEAEPGSYYGEVQFIKGDHSVEVPFSLTLYETVLPTSYALNVTHWFWPQPENVSYGNAPQWWSEEHWRLIEQSWRVLRAFGDNTLLTPIIDGRHPLIQTARRADGTYAFDFTRFDRWVGTAHEAGYMQFDGHHIGGGHAIAVPPMVSNGGVWVFDEGEDKTGPLFDKPENAEPWFAFLPVFYEALYSHLKEKGWLERYVQCQLDEPRDPEEYRRLADLARTHMPGVKTKDAINSRPKQFSPLVDIQVFALTILAGNAELAQERREQGQGVWVYHCCSPYPPHPNRHLDERLTNSRLYPWLAHWLDADGYLYWGANIYRGADPYKTSVGPVPNGSQNPGHPPGDNWMFYPTKNGLVPSMRALAFREGLQDHALLTMLAERDKATADAVMAAIARSLTDYERAPGSYHRARKMLLEALDARGDL